MHSTQDQPYNPAKSVLFFSLVCTTEQALHARWMIESLRAFGGGLKRSPVWIYLEDAMRLSQNFNGLLDVKILPLKPPSRMPAYYFGFKVAVCAQAEIEVLSQVRTLVWINPEGLFFQEPSLLNLAHSHEAAFRPVHIRNIGSPANEAPDGYWQNIYQSVGLKRAGFSLESFVDMQRIRPYFNTHLFAVDPSVGLLQSWLEHFSDLVCDPKFQRLYCLDELHQIFLHQAVLSALVVKRMDPEQIRLLPDEYSYPLHLHQQITGTRRIDALEKIVCAVYEDNDSHPANVTGLEINEPILSWLANRSPEQDLNERI